MSTPHEILKTYWGFDQFRKGQEEIVQSILDGKDTLALLPTGGGKSICFQVPGLVKEGITLVVSPLLALMSDQVNNLTKRGIRAVAVTSVMQHKEMDRVLDNCVYGDVKFLYVSPERLKSELFLARFKKMKIALIAIDEAHCISQWGYDFRPAYLEIAAIREFHPNAPVIALTASATPPVVKDIQEKLQFKTPHVLASSFARSNLSYNVVWEENKEAKLIEICKRLSGTGIVYCGTRLRTKEVAQLLQKKGITAGYYHAGLSNAEREKSYKSWLKNEMRIICATNAFGMGIDKPDVRFVIHPDVPPNPESYFQEAGRAGRDGQVAYAILIYHPSDTEKISDQIAQKYPEREFVAQVYSSLCDAFQIAIGAGKDSIYAIDLSSFSQKHKWKYIDVYYALQLLELGGYVQLNEAAWMPSRMMFIAGKQELYSFQVANPNMDGFIKTLLRMYGGMFDQMVVVRESEIAKNSRTTVQDVKKKIEILAHQGLVVYEAQTDMPRLTLLSSRVKGIHINLAPEIYEDRKRLELQRLHAMERYVERDRCRSNQLLEYFGEEEGHVCGTCDVCRKAKKNGFSPALADAMEKALLDIAIQGDITLQQLPETLPQFPKETLIEFARWKIDSGEIRLDDALRFVLPD